MTKFFTIFIFALLFVVNICAQSPKENRMVVINELAFSNPKSGISELIRAYDKIDAEFSAEFEAYNSINLEIAKIDKEIVDRTKPVAGCVGNINELIKEREKLAQVSKQKAENGKRHFDIRSSEIISPVLEKVESAIKEFEKIKGYKVVKASDLPEYTDSDPDLDKTTEFIAFYNKRSM